MAARRENNWLVPVGLVILAGWAFHKVFGQGILTPYAAGKYVQRMAVRIESAKLSKDGKFFTFNIAIHNPNNDPMIIKSIVGNLFLNQWSLGRVHNYGVNGRPLAIIAPNQETRVNLILKMDMVNALNMAANTLNTITNKQRGQMLTFKGTINANMRPWPIEQSVRIA